MNRNRKLEMAYRRLPCEKKPIFWFPRLLELGFGFKVVDFTLGIRAGKVGIEVWANGLRVEGVGDTAGIVTLMSLTGKGSCVDDSEVEVRRDLGFLHREILSMYLRISLRRVLRSTLKTIAAAEMAFERLSVSW